ncbi:methyltransferase domain-containing protein [Mycobacterium timonense]|uniref:Methyltransferase domain-containing protein n=2 Tax=Mycobacterium avium complex (MAC) TaxID=120793 RepID=A0AAW5SCN5_MYCBC|nr:MULTISPECIES: class I SAM-dependent methyltransferase [Mycobacterium avium complex (MAC)]MCV6993146.1 methyltransferase domain-containing protein [Mycobacterium bouchedurhonense]MCV6994112.1 methyltransferase domain-containing protein [Mycobacterium timonense]MDV3307040.1 class I SAM-dependent methyltransferase [Mycobacterium avium subsp. hominissuis]ORA42033.1 SAM-dependent methyltransferase [Mycobacterium bouchedurhonense]
MERTFEQLVAEADSVSVAGWDFSWLDGRATEERPSWGYQRLLRGRLAKVQSALDLYTGGGEVLAGARPFPPTMAAIEPWPPNIGMATQLLHPLGAVLIATGDEPPLPFAEAAFDLVTSRHPSTVWWDEIARVLKPGGAYFAQHVGVIYLQTLREYFLGPQPQQRIRGQLDPDTVRTEVAVAGLDVVDLRHEQIRLEFFDVGAVIYFLRKLSWVVPGFSVAEHHDKLLSLHKRIQAEGSFITHSSRVLIEARKPD